MDGLEEAWQSTPVFMSAESHGQRSLVGYSPWGPIEADMTDANTHTYGWKLFYFTLRTLGDGQGKCYVSVVSIGGNVGCRGYNSSK